jgi:hypothetical protein
VARSRARLLAAGVLALAAPSLAQLGDLYGRAWLRVDAPGAAEVRADLPLFEVSGLAGARGLRVQDLVLVIDLSDSTIEPCGLDLDGDGEGGTTGAGIRDWLRRQPDVRERLLDRVERQDFDDSVLMAELAAAYAIVQQVEWSAFRIGIVAFSSHAFVVAPVGSSREALVEALDHLRWNFFNDLGGTDFAEGVRVAAAALGDAPAGGRERSLLFLSDGATAGGTDVWSLEQGVLAAARAAADRGIRIFAYALGPESVQELDVYRGLAELSGGRFEKLDRPTEAVARLRTVDFAEVAELAIQNQTTGSAARALRSFSDGSFDALVELAPGPNRVRFTARARNGSTDSAERVVVYDPAAELAGGADAQRQRLAELADELRQRTAETRLIAEMAQRRPVQRREIEVRAQAARRAERAQPTPPVAAPPSR